VPTYLTITASVEMIRFSHSNKDTEDEEKGRGLVDKHDPYTGAVPKAKFLTTD